MNLDYYVDWCFKRNSYLSKDILSLPSNFLKLKIENNIVDIISCEILSDGKMEQRQESILKMIKKVCEKRKINNLILCYNTQDRPSFDGPFFTHARLKNIDTQSILAPCFTFESYPEGPSQIPVTFNETYEKLIKSSEIPWEEKNNNIIFVGHIGDNNNRKENLNFNEIEGFPTLLFNQQSTNEKFINREDLSNFKFLIHLNGNGGAYASRFKYLLGCKSLVFYNCNSGIENNFWEEWWMMDNFFIDKKHYILCESKEQMEKEIIFYSKNLKMAEKIATEGFTFFKNLFTEKMLIDFWEKLLNEYSKKIIWN